MPDEERVDPYTDPEDPLVQLGLAEQVADEAVAPENPDEEPEAEENPAEEEVSVEADRRWAGRFTSPEELERGYTELEQRFGRQGNELGQQLAEMRNQLAALAPPPQAPQTVTTSDGQELPMLTKEQLAEFYEDDPVEATLYMATLASLNAVQPVAEKFNAQLSPLTKATSDQAAAQVTQNLAKALPEGMFDRNRDALFQALEADKKAGISYPDQQTAFQRMRQIIITAEYDRGMVPQSTPQSGEPNGEVTRRQTVAVEGGSTPQPPGQQQAEPDPDFDWVNAPSDDMGPFGRRRRAAIR